ncbi:MAG: hypothetical protein A2539_00945 [Elusimicrobia bacterium RIFOXYD2_FULL_34_15]|nr:MAG: hypothetical protein A2539_00945 [Elusimicrobia bacterium RIFOXYD2_FULL_34_15]
MNKSIKKYYLFITLFVTGAAVMVLELIGTRVIAPTYGSGLFVWASLITVALTCLSIGYWLGGKYADKKSDFKNLYIIILIVGLSIAPIPKLSKFVLMLGTDLDFRIGALLSAYILFTIPLILLGMVSPYAIKLATSELKVLGSTAGKLYAVSTSGSFVGTLLTGFILIPNIGTEKILYLQSLILILLWVIYQLINKKYIAGLVSLCIFCLPIIFLYGFSLKNKESNIKLVYKTESIYGQIKVFDEGDERKIYFDNIRQSSINLNTYLCTATPYYSFESVHLFNPNGKNALLIGLAGANIPRRLWEYGINTDCVDIEQKMEYVARKYFGFLDCFGKIYIKDGRVYVKKTDKKYDFVVIDVFTGEDIPFHLLTKEGFQDVKKILNENGIVAINYLGEAYGNDSIGWKSVNKTLENVFNNVRVFSLAKSAGLKDKVSNIIFFASDNQLIYPKDFEKQVKGKIAQYIIDLYSKCELETDSNEGIVLMDNYCPIEFIRKNVAQRVRQKQIQSESQRYFF